MISVFSIFVQTVATEIASVTVTCTDDEKASLKAQEKALDSAAEELNAALEATMADLAGKWFIWQEVVLNKRMEVININIYPI